MVTLKELSDRITVETRSLLNRITKNKKDADTKFTAVNTRVDTTNARIDTTNTNVSTLSTSLGLVDTRLGVVETSLTPKPWQTWVPTFPTSGGQTFTNTTISHARYTVIGTTCFYSLRVGGTVGGTPGHTVSFTLPVPAEINGNASIGNVVIQDQSMQNSGYMIESNRTTVNVRKLLDVNGATTPWNQGTNKHFFASGFYEIQL